MTGPGIRGAHFVLAFSGGEKALMISPSCFSRRRNPVLLAVLLLVCLGFMPGRALAGSHGGPAASTWMSAQATGNGEDPWAEEGSTEEDPWADTEASGSQEDPWGEESGEEASPWQEEEDREETAEIPWAETPTEEKSPFELSGRLWNRMSYDVNEDTRFEDDGFNHAELHLYGAYDPGQGVDMLMSVDVDQFQYYNSGHWDNETNVRVHEAYVRLSRRWFELTLGNQFVRWGKIDQVSPLDIVNPEDTRDGLVRSREERKLPIPMVDLKLFKGLYKLEALFIPFFQESKLNLAGRDWALFDHYEQSVGSFRIEENDPPNDLEHSEFGLRFAGTFRKLDYALSYFRTREDLPSIRSLNVPPGFRVQDPDSATVEDLARFAVLTGQPIPLGYRRQHVYGMEFETTWRDFGIRGDFAYIDKCSFLNERLQQVLKPAFHYAVGIDYSRPGSFYANLQFSQQWIRHFEDGLLFADDVTNTVNGKVTKELWDSKLELTLRYLYNFTREDYYINPLMTLKYWQSLTLQLGVEFEGGPDESTLGLYDDNDEVYFIFKYHF